MVWTELTTIIKDCALQNKQNICNYQLLYKLWNDCENLGKFSWITYLFILGAVTHTDFEKICLVNFVGVCR